jgi:NAD+ synthase (glutamine-hydrolysing)
MVQAIPEAERQHDLIFENTQARQRTKLLMDWGFVLGTGDMSELFQGWCTYNADHQSMYNTNAGCPKTLARFLIRYLADKWYSGDLRDKLHTVAGQVITPELLPPSNEGEVQQDTEKSIGPFELIDFLMFEMCRHGFGPEKILFLGDHAQGWEKEGGYTRLERATWMKTHLQRFLEWSQYKRDDVPNGVKIGSVCLSPRSGNWRMASDGSGRIWIQKCDQLIAAAK